MKNYGLKIFLNNRIIPAVLATVAVSILTYILYSLNLDISRAQGSSAILFASFSVSAFILFMTPRSKAAHLDKFIKSYALGTALGYFGLLILRFLPLYVVAGLVMFPLSLLLYVTRSEHPPAVGIAMAFVLYRVDIYGVLIVIAAVIVLALLRIVLEKFVFIVENELVR